MQKLQNCKQVLGNVPSGVNIFDSFHVQYTKKHSYDTNTIPII